MVRALFIVLLLSTVLAGVFAQTERQEQTGQLMQLTILIDNKQYREAIQGFKLLEAQPATPAWLKAASKYEIAGAYAALEESASAITALHEAVQLGFDDCISPRRSPHLRLVLQDPKAAQSLAAMKITEADFHELAWLQAEVQHVRHDGRMMVIENTTRLDHAATVVPQAQLPARTTTSAAVLYWRLQLLLRQKNQREFVMKADILRIQHAARMAAITRVSPATVLESARKASATAESRIFEIRRRAFVPLALSSDRPKPCSEYNLAAPPGPS